MDVSAWTFRRGHFGTVVSATSNCLVRTRHIVVFGNDTLSCLETRHCHVSKGHAVLFGNVTAQALFSVETIKCSNNFFDCVNDRGLFRRPYVVTIPIPIRIHATDVVSFVSTVCLQVEQIVNSEGAIREVR